MKGTTLTSALSYDNAILPVDKQHKKVAVYSTLVQGRRRVVAQDDRPDEAGPCPRRWR